MEKDYYEILGIPKDTPKEEIKRAYSILAHQFHPDKNNGNEKRFKDITEAYRILSSDDSRRKYDQEFKNSYKEDKNEEVYDKKPSTVSDEEKSKNPIYIVGLVVIIGIIASLANSSNNTKNSINLPNSVDSIQSQNIQTSFKKDNEKCVEENGIKICDLKYSSEDVSGINYRNVFTDGNDIACVDMTNGEIIRNTPDKIRASKNPSYCVSDYGYVYIDPSLNVSKFYGKITRDSHTSPYKINTQYDTCLWTYQDGNGAIPYLEVLSSVGNRSGYSVAAFCKNNQSGVDIYTYKE